jgi:hypothetical protein
MNKPISYATVEQVAGQHDGAYGEEVVRLLARKNENGMAIITVTYSPAYVGYGVRTALRITGHATTENMKGNAHV